MSKPSFRQKISQMYTRTDGFVNTVTGLGGTRDGTTHMGVSTGVTLQCHTLDVLYSESHFVATIVDSLPEQALLKGVTIPEDTDKALSKLSLKWKVLSKIQEAAIWGRLFGGGLLVFGVTGLQDTPLDLATMVPGTLEYLLVLDRREFEKGPEGPDGEPEYYTMTRGDQTRIHPSRCVFFGGARTSRTKRDRNSGWDFSVVQRPYSIIRDAETNWRSVVHLLSDASQAVLSISNLVDLVSEGELGILQNRLEAIQMGRSVARAITIDAEHESFEQVGVANLAGAEKVLESTWLLVAAAARMPYTLLMGQSAAGMDATGKGDQDSWHNHISAYQTGVLEAPLTRVLQVIARDASLDFALDVSVEWPALAPLTDQEIAQSRLTVAQADALYLDRDVIAPEEVAIARWSGGGYSADMGDALDMDARQSAVVTALESLLDPPDEPSTAFGGPSNEEE